MGRNIGGSILASSDPIILKPKQISTGVLQVIPHEEFDTHILVFTRNGTDYKNKLVMHPNGYSCENLAKRLIALLDNTDPKKDEGLRKNVAEQREYILDCGGMASSLSGILDVVNSND